MSEIMFLSSFTCRREKKLSASGFVEHMTSLFSFNFLTSASSPFASKRNKMEEIFVNIITVCQSLSDGEINEDAGIRG